MNLLTIDKMSKSYSDRMLFHEVSFSVHEGDKIGIIGINGTGKSTLLKIIAGLEEADSGGVIRNNIVEIGYLPQIPTFDNDLTILENVLLNQTAEKEYHNLEGEAESMLTRLGIPDGDISPKNLSGGQKKRVALVRTLLTSANILILDEPTNHMDNEMTQWLENYLERYQGAFIMVTHDRYFLDNAVNRIVEIDKGGIYNYEGNFTRFIELKTAREEMELSTERKAKSLYKMELEWMQRGPRARSTKQKAHIKRFENLRDRKKVEVDDQVHMDSLSTRLGRQTIELKNIEKSFNNIVLIDNFSYILLQQDRIGIIGPNGCGKSTLLNIITGVLEPDQGEIHRGSTVKLGYFSQENEYLDESLRVIDYIRETAEYIQTPDGSVSAAQMCERFLFNSSMQYTFIGRLSGGEKRRLYLLKVLMESPNILILDEPTNDLDIQTLAILENYLETFPGIVLSVSHDRYFLDKMANRIFAFEEGSKIQQYEGNFTDYLSKKTSTSLVEQVDTPSSSPAKTWKVKDQKLKFTYQEQKEFDTIDQEVEELEKKLEHIDESTLQATTDYTKLNELAKDKEALEITLEEKMSRWVYLHELSDLIESEKN